MQGWKLYRSTTPRGPPSSSWVPPPQIPVTGQWQVTAIFGSGHGQWWNSSCGITGGSQTCSAIPNPLKMLGWAGAVCKQCLKGKTTATLKSRGSCPWNCKFHYFFHKIFTNGTSACGFACINFISSRLEMGFSLYPFPLDLGLSVSALNTISWLWSVQSVLGAESSAPYMKVKWPVSQKPVFPSRPPWVDQVLWHWSLCVSACKNQKTSILIARGDYPAYILKSVQMPNQLSNPAPCCRHHLNV